MLRVVLLLAFATTTATATPLHLTGGRLTGSDDGGSGQCEAALGWERHGSSWSMHTTNGTLRANMRLDVLGSGTPYFLLLDLVQYPDGHCTLSLILSSSLEPFADVDYHEGSYAAIEWTPLPYGGYLRDALARFAGGRPPVDLDRVRAQKAAYVAAPTAFTMATVARLNSDDWREREHATWDLIERPDLYPELRALTDLTPEQAARVARVLTPVDVPESVLALVTQ